MITRLPPIHTMSPNQRIAVIEKLCNLREAARIRLGAIADESARVAALAQNASSVLDNLEKEFCRQTSLDATDMGFLFFATLFHVAKWMIIGKFSHFGETADAEDRLNHNDPSIKAEEHRKREEFKEGHYKKGGDVKQGKHRDWMQIVFDSAPYDATKGWEFEGNHRLMSLGHDPVLGWIFGAMNFVTTSLTTTTFSTHRVIMHPLQATSDMMSLTEVVKETLESAREDKLRIPAAVFAQGVHIESDKYTKMGLPIPLLGTFMPGLAGTLFSQHYDALCAMRDFKTVGAQAFFAILIDMVLGLVHGLYYDSAKYKSRDVYEVKTRKILVFAKIIAESCNVFQAAVRASFGDCNSWKSLDFGGIGWALVDIIRSAKFIREVKEEFIFGQFDRMIKGKQN